MLVPLHIRKIDFKPLSELLYKLNGIVSVHPEVVCQLGIEINCSSPRPFPFNKLDNIARQVGIHH